VPPGTFVHVPPCARHSFRATEDGEVQYLYIKDRTWTLIGSAADESLPDEAPSATQVAKALKEGKWPGKAKEPQNSQAIIEGLGRCFYPMIEALDAPLASAHCEQWVEGRNLAFGLLESPTGHESSAAASAHEMFAYVIQGALDAEVDGEKKRALPGDLIHVPKNKAYCWRVAGESNARYAMVRSTQKLEAEIERNGAADNWRG
jgi:quercetin dioxygenase-like cupin family protein